MPGEPGKIGPPGPARHALCGQGDLVIREYTYMLYTELFSSV